MIAFSLPFHTIAGGNDHRGHMARYREIIEPQRNGATKALNDLIKRHEPSFIKAHRIPVALKKGKGKHATVYACHQLVSPILVKLTRVYGPGKRALDKHDNLQSSFKPIIDGLAIGMGLKTDDHELVKWEPNYQRKGPESSVEIQIWDRSVINSSGARGREVWEFMKKDIGHAYDIAEVIQGTDRVLGGTLRVQCGHRIVDVKIGMEDGNLLKVG